MGLRHHHHEGVPNDHESGDVTRPELDGNLRSRALAGGDHEAKRGGEDPLEPAVRAGLLGIDPDPHRVEAIGILGAHRARQRVRWGGRANRRAREGERHLRRTGARPLLETRCREEERQRP